MSCSFWDSARGAPPPPAAAMVDGDAGVWWCPDGGGGEGSGLESESGGAKGENGRRGGLLSAAPQNPRKLVQQRRGAALGRDRIWICPLVGPCKLFPLFPFFSIFI
jgi:hypothetical protein